VKASMKRLFKTRDLELALPGGLRVFNDDVTVIWSVEVQIKDCGEAMRINPV